MHTHFRAFFKKIFEKIYPFTCSHWEVPNYRVFLKNFLSGKKPSHLFGFAKPNDTLFHRENEKMFYSVKRNRHLVDNSSACISYLTENKGGTFYTVNYAKSKGVEVINIAE